MSEINRDEHPFDSYQKVWLDGRYVTIEDNKEFKAAVYEDIKKDDVRFTKLETSINTTLRVVQVLIIPVAMMVLSQIINYLVNK